MGFTKGLIDYEDGKYVVTLYYNWAYISEYTKVEKFDTLDEAKEWVLQERTYNQLVISDSALSELSYKDALKLQLKGKNSKYLNKQKRC